VCRVAKDTGVLLYGSVSCGFLGYMNCVRSCKGYWCTAVWFCELWLVRLHELCAELQRVLVYRCMVL
jgi:hypothetical protein